MENNISSAVESTDSLEKDTFKHFDPEQTMKAGGKIVLEQELEFENFRYMGDNASFSGNPEDPVALYLNAIGKTPLLTKEEEIELAKKLNLLKR